MKEAILYLGSRFCLVSGFSSDAICAGAVSRRGRETPDESSSRREAKEVDFTASESRRGERAVSNRETGTRKRRRYGGVARGTPGARLSAGHAWRFHGLPSPSKRVQRAQHTFSYAGKLRWIDMALFFFGRITCLIFTPSLSLLERHTPDHHCITSYTLGCCCPIYSTPPVPPLIMQLAVKLISRHQQSTQCLCSISIFFKRTSPRHA